MKTSLQKPEKVLSEGKAAALVFQPLSLLFKIPDAVFISTMLPFLDLEAQSSLAQTNRLLKKLLEVPLQKTHLEQLLLSVVHGEKEKAEALIRQRPGILLLSGRVIDYSGRMICGTALQMALGAEDINIFGKNQDGMFEMIRDYLHKIGGELIAAEQIKKQFPGNWKEIEEKNYQKDLAALEKVVAAMNAPKSKQVKSEEELIEDLMRFLKEREKDPFQEPPNEVIPFRKHWEDKMKEPIRVGRHFDIRILIRAYELLYENYGTWVTKDSATKVCLFWKQGIGYLLRFLPACYAHIFAQCSLRYFVQNKKNLLRSFQFRYIEKNFFPLSTEWNDKLGYDYTVDRGYKVRQAPKMHHLSENITALKELYSLKTKSLEQALDLSKSESSSQSMITSHQ